jgi:hypothetical protein
LKFRIFCGDVPAVVVAWGCVDEAAGVEEIVGGVVDAAEGFPEAEAD